MEEPGKVYQAPTDTSSIYEEAVEEGCLNPMDTLSQGSESSAETLEKGYQDPTDDPVPVPIPGQIPVQVHGTVQENKDKEEAVKGNPATLGRVITLWNETLGPLGFPQGIKVTPAREKAFKARLNASLERKSQEWWQDIIGKMALSNFMRDSAKKKANWLTFDWLLSENNLVKVIEGKYDNDKTQPGGSPQARRDEIPTSYDEAVAKYWGSDRKDKAFIDVEATEVVNHAETGLPGVL